MAEILSGFYGFLVSLYSVFPVLIKNLILCIVGVFVAFGLLKYYKHD